MHRRDLLSGCLGLVLTGPVASQGPPAPFRPIAYERVAADAGVEEASRHLKREDQVLLMVPPRYRLELTTAGRMQAVSERRRQALERWGTTAQSPQFTAIFKHEVEVSSSGQPFWLFWQDALVAPFRAELSAGGRLSVNVLLVGAIEGELLLLGIGFQSR